MSKREDYIEASLICSLMYPGISEILRGVFIQLGVKPQDIIESHDGVHFKVATFLTSLRKAKDLRARFRSLKLQRVSFKIRELKAKDLR